jgi:ferredoxin, 2Fe-2S
MKVNITQANGESITLESNSSSNLMELLSGQLADSIVAECRGSVSCGTCKVRVTDRWTYKLPPPSSLEQGLLDGFDSPVGSRLACQIDLTEGIDGLEICLFGDQYAPK